MLAMSSKENTSMKNREWTDTENEIIRENYPREGVVFTTRILRAAGFADREPQSVIRQASKLKVKRERTSRWTANYARRRQSMGAMRSTTPSPRSSTIQRKEF